MLDPGYAKLIASTDAQPIDWNSAKGSELSHAWDDVRRSVKFIGILQTEYVAILLIVLDPCLSVAFGPGIRSCDA